MKTKNATEKTMKVCLVGSSGGHLTHLYSEEFDIKTFDKESLDTATRCVLEMLNCKAYLLIYIASRLRKSKQDKLRGYADMGTSIKLAQSVDSADGTV